MILCPHANDYPHWRGEWFLFRCSWSMEIYVRMLGNTASGRRVTTCGGGMLYWYASISHLTVISIMVIMGDGYSLYMSKLLLLLLLLLLNIYTNSRNSGFINIYIY